MITIWSPVATARFNPALGHLPCQLSAFTRLKGKPGSPGRAGKEPAAAHGLCPGSERAGPGGREGFTAAHRGFGDECCIFSCKMQRGFAPAAGEAVLGQTQGRKGTEQDKSCRCRRQLSGERGPAGWGLAGGEGAMLSPQPALAPGWHPVRGHFSIPAWALPKSCAAAGGGSVSGPLQVPHPLNTSLPKPAPSRYLLLQGCHPLLEVQLQPLVRLAQQPVHGVREPLVVLLVHLLPLAGLQWQTAAGHVRSSGSAPLAVRSSLASCPHPRTL